MRILINTLSDLCNSVVEIINGGKVVGVVYFIYNLIIAFILMLPFNTFDFTFNKQRNLYV